MPFLVLTDEIQRLDQEIWNKTNDPDSYQPSNENEMRRYVINSGFGRAAQKIYYQAYPFAEIHLRDLTTGVFKSELFSIFCF